MIDPAARACFEARVIEGGDGDDAKRLAASLRAGGAAQSDLAALLVHAATAAPEKLVLIYDGATEGWLGVAPRGPMIEAHGAPEPIPAAFWDSFWSLVDDPVANLDAGEVTVRTAALAGTLPDLQGRVARCAGLYPGVSAAAATGYPKPFTLEALARCPAGSLGAEFHDLIVDNDFDLEVLDREALGLADMPAPLDYLNARILQCHDLWHLLAGYRTTALHEVAISGFQMAQFGHHYSSMFLGMVTSKIALGQAEALPLFLDTILSAWTHGRRSPPLIGLDWERLWDQPADAIRAATGVSLYVSPYPADLFEQMRAA
ncbi:MAG: Coq4 family protein [Phenylobacterium sp.]|nr:Coq4 family protein [Phenylobacterium sp.]